MLNLDSAIDVSLFSNSEALYFAVIIWRPLYTLRSTSLCCSVCFSSSFRGMNYCSLLWVCSISRCCQRIQRRFHGVFYSSFYNLIYLPMACQEISVDFAMKNHSLAAESTEIPFFHGRIYWNRVFLSASVSLLETLAKTTVSCSDSFFIMAKTTYGF